MKTIKIKVYEYDELNKTAKDKVLSQFRKDNDYNFLEEDLKESLKELLKENNIKEVKDLSVLYSLSYCQGDGFCFTGSFIWGRYNVVINHVGHYNHAKSVNISLYNKGGTYKDAGRPYNTFLGIYERICLTLEKQGYTQIEYENSEATIKENIEVNGYMFEENGRLRS